MDQHSQLQATFLLLLLQRPLQLNPSIAAAAAAVQARIDAQAESFDRNYSVPEAMDAPLLESALPVSVGAAYTACMACAGQGAACWEQQRRASRVWWLCGGCCAECGPREAAAACQL